MPGVRRLSLAVLVAVAFASVAQAQAPVLAGVWTWQSPGLRGIDNNAMMFNPDGGYVRASQFADGTITRSWGHYDAVQIAPDRIRLQERSAGWLPRQICSVVPGMARRCDAAPAPPPLDIVLAFASPTRIVTEGTTMWRQEDSPLLHLQAQAEVTTVLPQPVAPAMRAPIMPQMHPYTTPDGPGNRAANAYHQQNQNFVNGYMRGCVQDRYGRWVGCEQ